MLDIGAQGVLVPHDEAAVMLMMEEVDAVENINAITDDRGITALSIGLSDLSGSLGVPGQANQPSMQAAVDRVVSVAARKGVPVSLSVCSVEEVREALKRAHVWQAWEPWKRCCIKP